MRQGTFHARNPTDFCAFIRFPSREKEMPSRAKIFGHPIHPVLIVFPLGLFAMAVIFDIVQLVTGNTNLSVAAYYMIGAGIIGGLLAAVFGLIDWTGIPSQSRARSIGVWHGLGNVVVVLLFAISWWLRKPNPTAPTGGALTASYLGVLLGLFTGWLGGELVFRHGVGVEAPPQG
jgi:uncharacterized membrane protein